MDGTGIWFIFQELKEIFNTFTNNNQYATISFSSTHNTFLWKVMQFGVYSNLFKTTKKNNLIASIITSNEGDDFHKVISNAFIINENQPSTAVIPNSTGLESTSTAAIPNSTGLESTSTAAVPNSTGLESTSTAAVQSPELDFSLENLKKKKLKELKEIAKKNKITLGKGCTKKEDIAKKISSYLNPDENETQERERLINDLTLYNFTENPAIHQAYKKNFNLVDLHDREWYKFPFSFHVKHWRTKMMISLLTIAIVNSSTAYSKHQRSSGYLSFRENLEEKLLEKSK